MSIAEQRVVGFILAWSLAFLQRADHEMGIDLDNMNQVFLKSEFFAINALEATHESPINDKIILKEVKATLLSNKVTKDYKLLLKSGPREFEKSL